jgi:prevent-host-death family protein
MSTILNVSQDIRSLTDFKRHTSELTKHIKQSGRPVVLTVNGKAEFVIQDAASYQALAEEAERAITIAGIQRGLDEIARGESRPFDEFFKEFAAEEGIVETVE